MQLLKHPSIRKTRRDLTTPSPFPRTGAVDSGRMDHKHGIGLESRPAPLERGASATRKTTKGPRPLDAHMRNHLWSPPPQHRLPTGRPAPRSPPRAARGARALTPQPQPSLRRRAAPRGRQPRLRRGTPRSHTRSVGALLRGGSAVRRRWVRRTHGKRRGALGAVAAPSRSPDEPTATPRSILRVLRSAIGIAGCESVLPSAIRIRIGRMRAP